MLKNLMIDTEHKCDVFLACTDKIERVKIGLSIKENCLKYLYNLKILIASVLIKI